MNTNATNTTDTNQNGGTTPKQPTKRRWLLSLALGGLALATTAGFAATALAKPGGPGCGGHGGPGGAGGPSLEGLEQRLDDLDLGAEQEKAAYTLLDQARAEQRARRAEMRTARERMRELLFQDAPDPRAVEAQADALGALHTESQKAKLRTLLALRPLLTAEQWQALQPREPRAPREDRALRPANEPANAGDPS